MVRFIKYFISLTVVLNSLSTFGQVQNNHLTDKLKNTPQMIITNQEPGQKNNNPVTVTVTEIPDATTETFSEVLTNVNDSTNKDVVVTTDSNNIIARTAIWSRNRVQNIKTIMFKKIEIKDLANKTQEVWTRYKNNIVDIANKDRIGLMIITINTSYDSYIWIHAESLSVTEKTLQLFFNLFLTVTFSLDKEAWVKMTRPLEHRLNSFLEQIDILKEKTLGHLTYSGILSKYFSNLMFSMGIQSVRMSLLSLDQLVDSLTTMDFWTSVLKLSAVITASGFAWSEQFVRIDGEKHPVAKNIMRRMADIRSLIMGNVAPASKVLQPSVYGDLPMYTLIAHSAIGLITLLNADRITNWIEQNRVFIKIHEKTKSLNEKISYTYWKNKVLNIETPQTGRQPVSCQFVFSH